MKRITYYGSSMTGMFRNGDTLLVDEQTPFDAPVPGDIAVFICPVRNRQVVHRVIGRGAETILTQGDHCRLPDRPVEPGEFVGRVTGFERAGRYRRIHGGWRGRMRFRRRQGLDCIERPVGKFLRNFRFPPLPMRLKPRLKLSIFSDAERLMSGSRLVAVRPRNQAHWQLASCRWRIFFTESELERRFPKTSSDRSERP